jgi:hypothetical protein
LGVKLNGLKEKRIRCFFDIVGTIDELGTEPDGAETKKFFDAFKALEEKYNARADISFVSLIGTKECKVYLENLQKQFSNAGMAGRINGITGVYNYIGVDGTVKHNPRTDKTEAVEDYLKREKTQNDIAICIYAGDTQSERDIARAHEKGNLYKCPHRFIDTYKNNFRDITNGFCEICKSQEQNTK